MFAGQLGCEAVNFILKRIIKEERPRGKWIGSQCFKSYLPKTRTNLVNGQKCLARAMACHPPTPNSWPFSPST